METEIFLNKHVDVAKLDGFHIYSILRRIDQFGVWLEYNNELTFVSFNNIREMKLDRKFREENK